MVFKFVFLRDRYVRGTTLCNHLGWVVAFWHHPATILGGCRVVTQTYFYFFYDMDAAAKKILSTCFERTSRLKQAQILLETYDSIHGQMSN